MDSMEYDEVLAILHAAAERIKKNAPGRAGGESFKSIVEQAQAALTTLHDYLPGHWIGVDDRWKEFAPWLPSGSAMDTHRAIILKTLFADALCRAYDEVERG